MSAEQDVAYASAVSLLDLYRERERCHRSR